MPFQSQQISVMRFCDIKECAWIVVLLRVGMISFKWPFLTLECNEAPRSYYQKQSDHENH